MKIKRYLIGKRKIFLFLSLTILTFILLLYAIRIFNSGSIDFGSGINHSLPSPNLADESALTKMAFYKRASFDSTRDISKDSSLFILSHIPQKRMYASSADTNATSLPTVNRQKITDKLRLLQDELSNTSDFATEGKSRKKFVNPGNLTKELDPLVGKPNEIDPELKQLSTMLENILYIQHPDRFEVKATESKMGTVFVQSPRIAGNRINLLGDETHTVNGFYELNAGTKKIGNDSLASISIAAVIEQTQTIADGSIVKLRLDEDIMISGRLIPKYSFLYGKAILNGERMELDISSISYKKSIYTVNLRVYDLDGIRGIYIPGSSDRDLAKAMADRSVQTVGLTALDNTWRAQATGLGIEAAKSFLSHKVKKIRVLVKAGYRVILLNEK